MKSLDHLDSLLILAIFLRTIINRNSLADEFNTQLRFHGIYARDSNLFVVFTERRSDRDVGCTARDRALQVKMTCRFYFQVCPSRFPARLKITLS